MRFAASLQRAGSAINKREFVVGLRRKSFLNSTGGSLSDYGLTSLKSFLDSSIHKPSSLKRTINAKESSGFYVVILFDNGVAGPFRTGLSIKEQNLIYRISRYDLRSGQKKTKSTYFYFCDSHSWSPEPITQKQIVLCTKVAELAGDIKNIKVRTEQWRNFVDKTCENEAGCTSDLNYYSSVEEANLELTKTEKFYGDTARFILKKVNF